MQAFVAPLNELAEYEAIRKSRKEKQGLIQITGCVSSQKTHFMYALSDGFRYKIIACSSETKAKQMICPLLQIVTSKVYFWCTK